MGKRHHRSKADRQPVTRRYIARTVQRARDDIIRAVLFATAAPDVALERLEAEDWRKVAEVTEAVALPGQRVS